MTVAGERFTFVSGASDKFFASSASNTYEFDSVASSTGLAFDKIAGANYARDLFDVSAAVGDVTGVDATVTGNLSNATFASDLGAAFTASTLGAHHAALFQVTGGDYAGATFLAIDGNGTAGYQTGADLLIRMNAATGTLTTANFV